MTIWSLTPFLNELDVFEIRLQELDPVVDVHVVSESNLTFSGDPKPLFFKEALDSGRFDRWRDRIRHVVADTPAGKDRAMPQSRFHPHGGINWKRENLQRDLLLQGCGGMDDDDLVLLSDADEIPHASTVDYADMYMGADEICRMYLPQHVMYLNWRWSEATTVSVCRMMYGRTLMSLGPERARKSERGHVGHDYQGWHFSYMGGAEAIKYKIQSAAHGELDVHDYTDLDLIRERLAERRDMFDRKDRVPHVVPLSTLPQCVQDDPDRYSHLIDWSADA